MCGCKQIKWSSMSPTQVVEYKAVQEKKFSWLVTITEQKIAMGIPLANNDICPFCKKNVWFLCKNWCIVTWEKL